MEVRSPKLNKTNNDNAQVYKGKANNVPVQKPGVKVRDALRELNNNSQRNSSTGKEANIEKKKRYSHVQPKVDTGLACREVQGSSRPALRPEGRTVTRLSAKYKATVQKKENVGKKLNKLAPIIENQIVSAPTTLKPVEKVDEKAPHQNVANNHATLPKETRENKEIVTTDKLPSDIEDIDAENKEIVISAKLPADIEDIDAENKEIVISAKLPADIEDIDAENKEIVISAKLPADIEDIDAENKEIVISAKLPPDVEDIDATDTNNVTQMTEYIVDIYGYLLELEVKYPIESDYLKRQKYITAQNRATLIDWMVTKHASFWKLQESLQLAVATVDRYLQVTPNVKRSRLQLIGLTALIIATKYEEKRRADRPRIKDIIRFTSQRKDEIINCELDILQAVGYSLARPHQIGFLRRFVKAVRGEKKEYLLANYLVELCLVDYSMVHYKPSELAAAALCLSLHLITKKSLQNVWTPTVTYYSGYGVETLEPIVKQIAKIVANVEKSHCKAVYKKYSSESNSRVANIPMTSGAALRRLTTNAKRAGSTQN